MKSLQFADPFYLLLRFVVLGKFLRCTLEDAEKDFVQDNIHKHRSVLWINAIAMFFVCWGLLNAPKEDASTLISSLIGPVMVFGGAWYSISFGGVPSKLMDIAMSTTFWMFTAFLVSLSTMFIVVGFVSPPQIWPMLAIVFWGGYMSCVQYDTADGLKAGLDDKLLKNSIANLRFLKKVHNITPDDKEE